MVGTFIHTTSGGRVITMNPCVEPSPCHVARVRMALLDCGRFVRHHADYVRLVAEGRGSVESTVLHDVYAFSFSHVVTHSMDN